MPSWFHKFEVLWNHITELIAPFFVFGPRPFRHLAGLMLVFFQILLILSGNLSPPEGLDDADCEFARKPIELDDFLERVDRLLALTYSSPRP